MDPVLSEMGQYGICPGYWAICSFKRLLFFVAHTRLVTPPTLGWVTVPLLSVEPIIDRLDSLKASKHVAYRQLYEIRYFTFFMK